MGGEHLPLSNYDTLSADEIISKLDILTRNGTPDLQAIREYEEANEGRKGVLDHIDKIDGTDVVKGLPSTATPSTGNEGPAESQAQSGKAEKAGGKQS